MSALSDLSDLLNLSTGGGSGAPENVWWFKAPRVAGAGGPAHLSGRTYSLWTFDGSPGAGVAPTTVAIPTEATNGGLRQTDPGGGREKWLTSFAQWGVGNGGSLLLYDRLLHIGSLNASTTTPQTVGGTITRYTDGVGNIAWAEIYTTIGTSLSAAVIDYTDDAGNSGVTSPAIAFGATTMREQARVLPFPLAAGDKGIRAIASVDLTVTTGTAGNFGITLGHPLAIASSGNAGIAGWRDFTTGLPGIPEIEPDACLAMLWTPGDTTIADIMGVASFVEK